MREMSLIIEELDDFTAMQGVNAISLVAFHME